MSRINTMNGFCRKLLAAGVLMASVAMLLPASADQTYRNYRNARFGVSADVPSDWKAGREPDNQDGLVFSSPDSASTITISGILNADSTPAREVMAEEQRAQDGEMVTYRKADARQAVVSGTHGDMIFYRKTILSCGDQVLNHLVIEYPVAQKLAFDASVSHVAASMRSSPGEQIPKCK
jgi:serine/threonine-protein kinase